MFNFIKMDNVLRTAVVSACKFQGQIVMLKQNVSFYENAKETLDALRKAKTISDLAKLLQCSNKELTFILYKMPEESVESDKGSKIPVKYMTFSIPKKTYGERIIHAPTKKLKRIQQKLNNILWQCVYALYYTVENKENKENKDYKFWPTSHGFLKHRTIVSNSHIHRNHRFVFNIDLENFFGTIQGGRIRNFFINNNKFKLDPKIATLIAQIACYKNILPQGSPCSPILSNLIGNILDIRLIKLAKKYRCSYTRYADDITFSSNMKCFPKEIAKYIQDDKWEVGELLKKEIEDAWFTINYNKVRMNLRQSRQMVTGLVVNEKVNIDKVKYKRLRAMCFSLFQTGKYQLSKGTELTDNLNMLSGLFSHANFVKKYQQYEQYSKRDDHGKKGFVKLYYNFLSYKYFVGLQEPLIITEGKTDIQHLRNAIKQLSEQNHEKYSKFQHEKLPVTEKYSKIIKRAYRFLPLSKTVLSYLRAEGTSGQGQIIKNYRSYLKNHNIEKFLKKEGNTTKLFQYPIIVLCDNDKGIKDVFTEIKECEKIKSCLSVKQKKGEEYKPFLKSQEDFYHIIENLYVIKLPEKKDEETCIEELYNVDEQGFTVKILAEEIILHYKQANKDYSYSKEIFSQKIAKEIKEINFSGFMPLLDRILSCMQDYEKRCLQQALASK